VDRLEIRTGIGVGIFGDFRRNCGGKVEKKYNGKNEFEKKCGKILNLKKKIIVTFPCNFLENQKKQ
jgi:hypothetical protein